MDVTPLVTFTHSGQSQTKNTSLASSDRQLSEQEKQLVQKLQTRDRSVRAHEAAHIAAGGQVITSPANFTYQKGPDGQRYAVGGEVGIDVSKAHGDPQATLEKAQLIRRAALAPAQPSAQDRNIAAQASHMAIQARAEIRQYTEQSNAGDTSAQDRPQKDAASGKIDFTV